MTEENVRRSIETKMCEIALDPADIARAVSFAIGQPDHVDVGDMGRPTIQS
jgi:NADP-dependent 3-hydroxy acid dehydrogenase YdfG